ncbi:unnamed protein product [Diatraea saccharalis]|uniref:sn-1-specific diacylglycerol lipase n=1 Tax=Diatraea saccharalis TaxID=40085 RepID=A0A9N9QUW6_9NEOP|nr:unnamed protein product [Diatraea saccharalis]
MVFDPLGSVRYGDLQDTPNQVRHHKKVTGLWSRRFRWAFCWLKRDEHGKEAFQQVAVAGCVLLRVRQKRETREMRRIQMLNDEEPIYTTDVNKVFSETPPWMNLDDALHYLRLSIAAYGWPYLPFCVIADHDRESIVVAVRGSISLRDIFTDFTAGSEKFEADGLPEDTAAHKGHSLGAGVAVLVALKLRPRYPHLKVFAFSTPAGLISREAARYTESFVLTVGVGDDLVMRLSVHSIENLRTKVIQTIHATKLPKVRNLL